MGDDTTAQRLRLLQAEFVQPTRSGPGDGRKATQVEAPAPLNIGIVDRMAAAAAEIDDHMRAVEPPAHTPARPRPANPADRYEWWRHGTAHLAPQLQDAREQVIYRQGLEYDLAMGDTSFIRRHPCPGCGCWGLFWREAQQAAVCVNHYCVDDDGLSRTWSLAHLAQQHIARQKSLKISAT
ncbi:hypothetical protein ABZ826_23625 [Streptomyces sp. NPDC047515]|uniref:hypothetical protein n=1 Tax=Streptomyces sp. NPDC047515 TaxID=3155380 RepID=UPI0033D78A43